MTALPKALQGKTLRDWDAKSKRFKLDGGASVTSARSSAFCPLRRTKSATKPQIAKISANRPMISARTHSGSNGCASPKPISGPANQTTAENAKNPMTISASLTHFIAKSLPA